MWEGGLLGFQIERIASCVGDDGQCVPAHVHVCACVCKHRCTQRGGEVYVPAVGGVRSLRRNGKLVASRASVQARCRRTLHEKVAGPTRKGCWACTKRLLGQHKKVAGPTHKIGSKEQLRLRKACVNVCCDPYIMLRCCNMSRSISYVASM